MKVTFTIKHDGRNALVGISEINEDWPNERQAYDPISTLLRIAEVALSNASANLDGTNDEREARRVIKKARRLLANLPALDSSGNERVVQPAITLSQ